MSTPKAEPVPIPGPRGVPLMGNILDIESEIPLRSLEMMADTYGMNNGDNPVLRINIDFFLQVLSIG